MTPMRSLYAGLGAYWPLNDVYDLSGAGNTLSNPLSASFNSGGWPRGDGVTLVSASGQYLSVADNALLSTGNIDYTLCCWVNLTSKGSDRSIISKYGSSGQREYNLWFNNATDRFNFTVSGDGTATTVVADSSVGSPSTSTWYFIRAWHDATGDTINIQTNSLAPVSAAHSTGSFDSTSAMLIGAVVPSAPTNYLNGFVADVGFWKRILSSSEHEWLYNNGRGRRFPWVNGVDPHYLNRGSGTMVRRNRITGVIV